MKTYGYVRVSTRDQNLARQMDSMHAFGIPDERIYADKQSGKNFDRPAYEKLLKKVKEGDLIVFHSLDRMGRDYVEMGEQWHYITEVKKVNVKVLDMPLLDTEGGPEDITRTLIGDIVFKLLCYLAQVEREAIHKRQQEGILAAKERGVRFGRPAYEKPSGYEECALLWQEGKISSREAAKRMGCSHTLFLNWMRQDGYVRLPGKKNGGEK